MSGRLAATHAYELYSRDESLPLSQLPSPNNALRNTKSAPSPVNQEAAAMAPPPNTSAPRKIPVQRQHFVFTDPVAFRFVPFRSHVKLL